MQSAGGGRLMTSVTNVSITGVARAPFESVAEERFTVGARLPWRGLTAIDVTAAAVAASMVALLVPLGPGYWSGRVAVLLAVTPLDTSIARALFFDSASGQWIGQHGWLTNEVLHTGCRWAIRVIVAVALAFLAATFARRDWREFRRPAAFFALAAQALLRHRIDWT